MDVGTISDGDIAAVAALAAAYACAVCFAFRNDLGTVLKHNSTAADSVAAAYARAVASAVSYDHAVGYRDICRRVGFIACSDAGAVLRTARIYICVAELDGYAAGSGVAGPETCCVLCAGRGDLSARDRDGIHSSSVSAAYACGIIAAASLGKTVFNSDITTVTAVAAAYSCAGMRSCEEFSHQGRKHHACGVACRKMEIIHASAKLFKLSSEETFDHRLVKCVYDLVVIERGCDSRICDSCNCAAADRDISRSGAVAAADSRTACFSFYCDPAILNEHCAGSAALAAAYARAAEGAALDNAVLDSDSACACVLTAADTCAVSAVIGIILSSGKTAVHRNVYGTVGYIDRLPRTARTASDACTAIIRVVIIAASPDITVFDIDDAALGTVCTRADPAGIIIYHIKSAAENVDRAVG